MGEARFSERMYAVETSVAALAHASDAQAVERVCERLHAVETSVTALVKGEPVSVVAHAAAAQALEQVSERLHAVETSVAALEDGEKASVAANAAAAQAVDRVSDRLHAAEMSVAVQVKNEEASVWAHDLNVQAVERVSERLRAVETSVVALVKGEVEGFLQSVQWRVQVGDTSTASSDHSIDQRVTDSVDRFLALAALAPSVEDMSKHFASAEAAPVSSHTRDRNSRNFCELTQEFLTTSYLKQDLQNSVGTGHLSVPERLDAVEESMASLFHRVSERLLTIESSLASLELPTEAMHREQEPLVVAAPSVFTETRVDNLLGRLRDIGTTLHPPYFRRHQRVPDCKEGAGVGRDRCVGIM